MMFNGDLEKRIYELENFLDISREWKEVQVEDCRFDSGYRNDYREFVASKQDREIERLKAIVAELCDYVYRENK